MLRTILGSFLTIIVPPRHSERIVQMSSAHEWLMLQTPEGLPYHNAQVTALIWELKYFGNAHAAAIVAPLLAERILECASEEIGTPLLIPIPIHPTRRSERGYNQCEILCGALLPYLTSAVAYHPDALVRTTHTPHQQGLERSTRLTNVENSMKAHAAVRDRVCIVIDDVATTGATLKEATRALTEAGARKIYTLALAYS